MGKLISNLMIVPLVAESVSVTSNSTFLARKIELNKKRAELEAAHAFTKAEAEANKNILSKSQKRRRKPNKNMLSKSQKQISNLKSLRLN